MSMLFVWLCIFFFFYDELLADAYTSSTFNAFAGATATTAALVPYSPAAARDLFMTGWKFPTSDERRWHYVVTREGISGRPAVDGEDPLPLLSTTRLDRIVNGNQ